MRVVLAGAKTGIQQLAGDMGEIDPSGVFILELFEAAPCTTVAQAFPFSVGHLFQRLGFPEESLLVGSWFGLGGHGSWLWAWPLSLRPSRAWCGRGASGLQDRATMSPLLLSVAVEIMRWTIGLWRPLG